MLPLAQGSGVALGSPRAAHLVPVVGSWFCAVGRGTPVGTRHCGWGHLGVGRLLRPGIVLLPPSSSHVVPVGSGSGSGGTGPSGQPDGMRRGHGLPNPLADQAGRPGPVPGM